MPWIHAIKTQRSALKHPVFLQFCRAHALHSMQCLGRLESYARCSGRLSERVAAGPRLCIEQELHSLHGLLAHLHAPLIAEGLGVKCLHEQAAAELLQQLAGC